MLEDEIIDVVSLVSVGLCLSRSRETETREWRELSSLASTLARGLDRRPCSDGLIRDPVTEFPERVLRSARATRESAAFHQSAGLIKSETR